MKNLAQISNDKDAVTKEYVDTTNDYVESAELIDSGGGEIVDHWVKVGNMSTTNGNTASAAFAYWLTRFAPMVELSGKNLYAIEVD